MSFQDGNSLKRPIPGDYSLKLSIHLADTVVWFIIQCQLVLRRCWSGFSWSYPPNDRQESELMSSLFFFLKKIDDLLHGGCHHCIGSFGLVSYYPTNWFWPVTSSHTLSINMIRPVSPFGRQQIMYLRQNIYLLYWLLKKLYPEGGLGFGE